MSKTFEFTAGEGRYVVTVTAELLGKDVALNIYGGTHPHIGAVVMGTPRPSLDDPNKLSSSASTLCGIGHKDDVVGRVAALRYSATLNCVVSVTCGIHIDDAEVHELMQLQANAETAMTYILHQISEYKKAERAAWEVDEEVIAVKESGETIGPLSRDVAHRGEGQLHLAFETILLTDEGKLMFCRRSDKKKLWAGYLAGACAGHPFPGEDVVHAGQRRVKEELGMDTELEQVGHVVYQEQFGDDHAENEYCVILVGEANEFTLNAEEVSEVVYLSLDEYRQKLERGEDKFAPWIIAALENPEVLLAIENFDE